VEEVGVPQLRDFLDRFRPAGAPGAIARAAVPSGRSRQVAELSPVLDLLGGTQAECEQVIAQAGRDAVRIVAEARAQAAAVAAEAERRARSVGDEAARQVVDAARADARQALDAAAQQAARERQLATQRIPALVSRAVDLVRALPADGWAPAGHDPGGRP